MNDENKQKRSELKEQARAKLDDNRNRYAKIFAERNQNDNRVTYDNRASKRMYGNWMHRIASRAAVKRVQKLQERFPFLTTEQLIVIADRAYWKSVIPNQTKTPLGEKENGK